MSIEKTPKAASQAAQPAEADGVERVIHGCEACDGEDQCTCRLLATPPAPATDAGEVERAARQVQNSVGMWDKLNERTDPKDAWAAYGEQLRHDAMRLIAALATPPAPNNDLRAAAELVARAVGVSVMPDGTAWALVFPRSEPQPLLADIFSARAALKENRRG